MGLLNVARTFLTITLTGKSLFSASFLTWLQVKRMPLDFFHNVFLLDLAFEAAERTFKSFAILQMDFSHEKNSPPSGTSYCSLSLLITLPNGRSRFERRREGSPSLHFSFVSG